MSLSFFEQVDRARNRGGEPADDRPQQVDSLLKSAERLGYGVGEPLGNVDDYSNYPDSREGLLLPSATPLLASIVDSDVITDVSDLSTEMNISESVLVDVLEFHRIDLPRESDKQPSPYVAIPTDNDEQKVDKREFTDDFLTAYTLYVVGGMGVDELSELLEESEREIETALRQHGLL
jgi:hypothetical protein